MPGYDASQFDPPAPVATVTLRRRRGERGLSGVLMVIDSGADVSLIPAAAVRGLGLDESVEKSYEVTAFDGTESMAVSVRCELVFLRRVFRGAYLVVEDAIGILGRDVLNHLSLVLDGPALHWREEQPGE